MTPRTIVNGVAGLTMKQFLHSLTKIIVAKTASDGLMKDTKKSNYNILFKGNNDHHTNQV